MPFRIQISEQGSISQIVRAVELALALDDVCGASVHLDFDAAPWRHLLSGLQQLHLRRITPDRRKRAVDSNYVPDAPTQLWLRPLHLLPACPPEHTWLVTTGGVAHPDPQRQDLWFGCIQTVAPGYQIDQRAAATQMSVAVCTQTFARRPLGHFGVVVIGSGDAAQDARMVHALQGTCDLPLTLLDIYTHHVEAILPPQVEVVHVLPPKARAVLYAKHAFVISGAPDILTDDHFVCEARHMGLIPLAHFAETTSGVWDADSLMRAWRAADRVYKAPHDAPLPLSLADTQAQAIAIDRAIHAVCTLPAYHAGHIHQYSSIADAGTSQAQVCWLDCGRGALWSEAYAAWIVAQPYTTLYVDISRNTLLLTMLFTTLLTRQLRDSSRPMPHIEGVDSPSTLVQLASDYMAQHPGCHLDVVHLACTSQQVLATRQRLKPLNESPRRSQLKTAKSVNKPLFLFNQDRPQDTTQLSQQMIGAPVAAEGVFQGIVRNAQARFDIIWPRSTDYISGFGRIYFYPHHTDSVARGELVDVPQIREALQQNQLDLIMSGGPLITEHLMARRLWAQRAVPVVGLLHSLHTIFGHVASWTQLSWAKSLKSDLFISPTVCGKIAQQHQFDATSEALLRRTGRRAAFKGEIKVIPYGIDTSWYQSLNKGTCRSLLGLPHDRCIMLSLGRFHRHEKFDLLPVLLAVQQMVLAGDNPLLVLAGADKDTDYAQDMQGAVRALKLEDYVTFRTNIASTHKPYLYGACDIFVSPSDNIQETYGLTVIEAMAAGLPVVASRWDGYRELVVDGVTGFLIATRWCDIPQDLVAQVTISAGLAGYGHRDLHESVAIDIAALTKSLRLLYADRALRLRLGENGLSRAQTHYDVGVQSGLIADVLVERVDMAKHESWASFDPDDVPFIDNVSQRFGHYTPDIVDPSLRLTLTDLSRDEKRLATTVALIDLGGAVERQKVEQVVRALQQGPQSLATLNAASFDTLRLLRLLKYGIVGVAE